MPRTSEVDPLVLKLQDLDDLRVAIDGREQRIRDRTSDAPGECQELVTGQVLVTEEDDQVVKPGTADLVDLLAGQLVRQVDAGYHGANRTPQLRHLDRHPDPTPFWRTTAETTGCPNAAQRDRLGR